jgi:hypothetical protein
MKINVNDKVRLKLTEHGHMAMAMCEYLKYDKVDADGWLELHLWEAMLVFGPFMFNGNPNLPFETNIELKRPVIVGQQGSYWIATDDRWSNWFDITFNTWVPEEGVRRVRYVYAEGDDE